MLLVDKPNMNYKFLEKKQTSNKTGGFFSYMTDINKYVNMTKDPMIPQYIQKMKGGVPKNRVTIENDLTGVNRIASLCPDKFYKSKKDKYISENIGITKNNL